MRRVTNDRTGEGRALAIVTVMEDGTEDGLVLEGGGGGGEREAQVMFRPCAPLWLHRCRGDVVVVHNHRRRSV
jgi:hypothetical protein